MMSIPLFLPGCHDEKFSLSRRMSGFSEPLYEYYIRDIPAVTCPGVKARCSNVTLTRQTAGGHESRPV